MGLTGSGGRAEVLGGSASTLTLKSLSFLLTYMTMTRRRTAKADTAARNAVASAGTENKSKDRMI
jgi:hypothetical protein